MILWKPRCRWCLKFIIFAINILVGEGSGAYSTQHNYPREYPGSSSTRPVQDSTRSVVESTRPVRNKAVGLEKSKERDRNMLTLHQGQVYNSCSLQLIQGTVNKVLTDPSIGEWHSQQHHMWGKMTEKLLTFIWIRSKYFIWIRSK